MKLTTRIWKYQPGYYRVEQVNIFLSSDDPFEKRVRFRQSELFRRMNPYIPLVIESFQPILQHIRQSISERWRWKPPRGVRFFPEHLINRFANTLTGFRLYAELLGRAHTRRTRFHRIFLAREDEYFVYSFLEGIPFREAIAALVRKRVISPDEFKQLTEIEKLRNFSIAHVTAIDVLDAVKQKLHKSLEEGMTFKQFRDEVIEDVFKKKGVTPIAPYHLENVYRTNLFSAYMAGRWRQIVQHIDVIKYLRYITMEDERVRPSHAKMHGYTASPLDPIWQVWFPPNGYNCRCDIEIIFADDPEIQSIRPSRRRVSDLPDKGFQIHPAWDDIPDSILKRMRKYGISTNIERELYKKLQELNKNVLRVSKRLLRRKQQFDKDFAEWASSLSRGHRESLRFYQEEGGHEINRYLRFGVKPSGKNVLQYIRRISEAIERGVLQRDTVVYRGLDSATFFKINERDEIYERAFFSTSLDKEIALRYAQSAAEQTDSVPVLLKIRVRKGTHVAWMPSIAEDVVKEREFELLFPPEGRIIIERIRKVEGLYVVEGELKYETSST